MSYPTYLRWGVLTGLFLVPFVPFIVANGDTFPNLFFPFITGKNFAFRIIVELTFALYVLLALCEPKYRPRSSYILWIAAAFALWMGVATAFSVDPVKSLWSNFERMEGYIGLLHLFAYFLVAGSVLAADNLWRRFFNTTIAASALMGCYALLQIFGAIAISTQSGARVDTTFGNATYAAVYFLIHIFLTLFMLARAQESRNASTLQILYGVALVVQIVGLLFTETRGAILGLGGGIIVAALYLSIFGREKGLRTLRLSALGIVAAVVIAGGLIFALKDTAFIKEVPVLRRIASTSLTETTVQSRLLYIWPMAWQGFLERPVTGWGQENFNYVFNKYYEPELYIQEAWFDRAHNQFLDWLVAGGLLAFLLHVALYAYSTWVFFRSEQLLLSERAALLGLMAGYTFNNLFVFDNLMSAVLFFTLLAFAHGLSKNPLPRWVFFTKPLQERGMALVAPVVAVLAILGVWSLNAPGLLRASTLVNAIQTLKPQPGPQGQIVGVSKEPSENLEQFKLALAPAIWPQSPLGRQEVVEQLLQFASTNIAPRLSANPQVSLEFYTQSAGAIAALMQERKGDARLELFAGTFLGNFGNNAEAISMLKQALEHSPQKQQILFQLALTYVQAGDPKTGLDAFRQAYELAPDYEIARILYAAGHYYNNDTAAGDALLIEKWGTVIVDNPQLMQVYTNTRKFDRLIEIWKLRVAAEPKNEDTLLGLAQAYFAANRLEETVETLRAIIAANPARAGEIQPLITQIENGTLKP